MTACLPRWGSIQKPSQWCGMGYVTASLSLWCEGTWRSLPRRLPGALEGEHIPQLLERLHTDDGLPYDV